MTDTPSLTRAFKRSFSSAVQRLFLTAMCAVVRCCISASDYREARSAQDVNLLHIPAEPSFWAHFVWGALWPTIAFTCLTPMAAFTAWFHWFALTTARPLSCSAVGRGSRR